MILICQEKSCKPLTFLKKFSTTSSIFQYSIILFLITTLIFSGIFHYSSDIKLQYSFYKSYIITVYILFLLLSRIFLQYIYFITENLRKSAFEAKIASYNLAHKNIFILFVSIIFNSIIVAFYTENIYTVYSFISLVISIVILPPEILTKVLKLNSFWLKTVFIFIFLALLWEYFGGIGYIFPFGYIANKNKCFLREEKRNDRFIFLFVAAAIYRTIAVGLNIEVNRTLQNHITSVFYETYFTFCCHMDLIFLFFCVYAFTFMIQNNTNSISATKVFGELLAFFLVEVLFFHKMQYKTNKTQK